MTRRDDNDAIEIRDIPQRGKALVATRDLSPGAEGFTVLQDDPLIISPFKNTPQDQSDPCPKEISRFLDAQFWTDYWYYLQLKDSKTKQKIRNLFYMKEAGEDLVELLTKVYNVLPKGTKKSYLDIEEFANVVMVFRYNSVGIAGKGRGLFEYACRLNHSCLPNCAWYTNEDGQQVVRLVQDVSKGEEFTVDYVESRTLPTNLRQDKLWKTKSFWCECPRCSKLKDDARRFPCLNCRDDDKGVHFVTASSNQPHDRQFHLAKCEHCSSEAIQSMDMINQLEESLRSKMVQLNETLETSGNSVSQETMDSIRQLRPPHRLHSLAADSFFIVQANEIGKGGDKEGRIKVLRDRLDCYISLLGADYPNVLTGLAAQLLADALIEGGRVPEAKEHYERALRMFVIADGPDRSLALTMKQKLAAL